MKPPVPDALRTQLAEEATSHRFGFGSGGPGAVAYCRCGRWDEPITRAAGRIKGSQERWLGHVADALAPFLARGRVEGAAEALREAAEELPRWALTLPNGADPQEVADWLDARADRRAAALSASTTTEGDPT